MTAAVRHMDDVVEVDVCFGLSGSPFHAVLRGVAEVSLPWEILGFRVPDQQALGIPGITQSGCKL